MVHIGVSHHRGESIFSVLCRELVANYTARFLSLEMNVERFQTTASGLPRKVGKLFEKSVAFPLSSECNESCGLTQFRG
jgi:hypothetical protein